MKIDPIHLPALTPEDIDRISGCDRRGQAEASRIVMKLIAEAASHSGVSEAEIRSTSRIRKLVRLRQIVMFRAHEMGLSLTQIARALRMDHTTVLHGIRREREARP